MGRAELDRSELADGGNNRQEKGGDNEEMMEDGGNKAIGVNMKEMIVKSVVKLHDLIMLVVL